MSRIGNRIIMIPEGVTVENNDNVITVKGDVSKEEDVKNKYPSASLHQINKNRICLTINQLRLILGLKDDDFNNILAYFVKKN